MFRHKGLWLDVTLFSIQTWLPPWLLALFEMLSSFFFEISVRRVRRKCKKAWKKRTASVVLFILFSMIAFICFAPFSIRSPRFGLLGFYFKFGFLPFSNLR